jgi:large conductance mechanosensitive channel
MLNEFKEFAVRGNVVDMAVGIIIGAAFGTVVSSMVSDILMPVVAGVIGTPDFSNLFVVLRNPNGATDLGSVALARESGAVVLAIGLFVNAVIAFLIVCAALFFVVRGINSLRRQPPPAPVAPLEPPPQERLLAEIRDLLRGQQLT